MVTNHIPRLSLFALSCAFLVFTAPSRADKTHPHEHPPIVIPASPSVERLAVTLDRPRRIILDQSGALIVADWGVGSVIKIPRNGEQPTVLAADLNEPAGLAIDPIGNLFITVHAQGVDCGGAILKLTPSGEQSLFASGLTGPIDVAFSPSGELYVALREGNRVVRIDDQRLVSPVADDIPSPSAIAFNNHGRLLIASAAEGTLSEIDSQGRVNIVARGLVGATDIALDQSGHVIVTNVDSSRLSHFADRDTLKIFANVPKGTVAITFDQDNNFFLVNWHLRLLMKVSTHLFVPCPHCDGRIPIHLVPRRKDTSPVKPMDDMGPVI